MGTDLRELLGDIDIYRFDQILKGRLRDGVRVLDVGCGKGRNLVWPLRAGHPVFAVDQDPECVAAVRALAARLAPALPEQNFRVARVEELPFDDASFDVVLCSAVLHFANDANGFETMVRELWRVLAPGGMLFTRLASSEGIAARLEARGNGRFGLPDGTERYLIDDARLEQLGARLGARLLDPIKTTLVHGKRAMATWVVAKEAAESAR